MILIGYWKIHMGNRTFLLYFLTNLIGYLITPLLFDTPCLKNNWVFQKNNWVNTPKNQRYVFLRYCVLHEAATSVQ